MESFHKVGCTGGSFLNHPKYTIIAYTKKYLQSDWLRGVQYWLYLYSVFNICTLWLNKKKYTTFKFRSGKIEMHSLKTNSVNY